MKSCAMPLAIWPIALRRSWLNDLLLGRFSSLSAAPLAMVSSKRFRRLRRVRFSTEPAQFVRWLGQTLATKNCAKPQEGRRDQGDDFQRSASSSRIETASGVKAT